MRYNLFSPRILRSISNFNIMYNVRMKCKFRKQCPNYEEDSFTCNKSDGYYGDKPATCYKKMENKK